ncbi:MAG: glycoside hydrolase family 13 protein [Bacteroidota bacterium]
MNRFSRFLSAVPIAMLSLIAMPALAAFPVVDKVEPANWWVGMKHNKVQVLMHGDGLAKAQAKLSYPGVTISGTAVGDSPNYLFVTLNIGATAKPGSFDIVLSLGADTKKIPYTLYGKPSRQGRILGFNPSDVMYMIFPDRFANGNPANDDVAGMREKANRKNEWGRHGGDLAGIVNNLDYLQNLGVNTLWLNPVLENDMPGQSYHGYAITDLYKIDPRFGSNEEYKALVEKCHSRSMKVVMDMVANHIGIEHLWMKDAPQKTWVHRHAEYINSNFRLSVVSDPYASSSDSNTMLNGWFSRAMPDLAQDNKMLATYLIQNTLWWIAYSGLDGIRMDTWPYPDKDFMSDWLRAIEADFPGFSVVGEVWSDDVALEAYFKKGAPTRKGYVPELQSLTDFPLRAATQKAFNDAGGWDSGLMRLYNILAMDFQYDHPEQNVIFLDNHDLGRFASEIKSDINKYKLALTFLLTTRGVPQIYYGTEIMMEGFSNDAEKRHDFPGGWEGDTSNVFKGTKLGAKQTEALSFTKNLLNRRKNNPVFSTGKLKHFIPEDNVYVYFRYNAKAKVMVILNGDDKAKKLKTKRFAEIVSAGATGTDVLSGKSVTIVPEMELPARSAMVIELK